MINEIEDTFSNKCPNQKTPPVPQITPNLLSSDKNETFSIGWKCRAANATEDLAGNHPAQALMPVRQHNQKVN